LLLNSTSKRFPNGLCNNEDQVGRYVMVQGATQSAGRWPDEVRGYKAPPPEVSSEQFYETDESRGFARGFSIQTVHPLPIEWAQHILADGHWGWALREYARDYNHWGTVGVLNELLPQPENRVTLADEKDEYGMPIAHFNYNQCENDQALVAFGKRILSEIWEGADAMDTLTIDRFAHLVGGCRMGFSPDDSVVDRNHRVWGVDNLFVVDGSVLPTQGAANPALAIMALADRCARLLH
jgi:choline dehydrogenase-like flavoprotein